MSRFNRRKAEAYEPTKFFVHQPTEVAFAKVHGDNKVIIDGEWQITLDKRNPVVGQLALGVDPELLKPQFQNGRFFIVDDHVIDYREADRLNFCHDQAAIEQLASTIGFMGSDRGGVKAGNKTAKMDYEAFKTEGGVFEVDIGFDWSPFSLDILSELFITRLVCENGMVARNSLMNHRIPMLNAWEENLAISNQVIAHNFNKLVGPRMAAMVTERISMYDVRTMSAFITDLSDSKDPMFSGAVELEEMLKKLEPLFVPEIEHMKSNMLKFLEVPISAYDAMNIATECATHYVPSDKTGAKAEMFANSLIFDRMRQSNMQTDLNKLIVDTQTFHSPDAAFFGATCH